jgi:hypothetical protein
VELEVEMQVAARAVVLMMKVAKVTTIKHQNTTNPTANLVALI